jgi:hypothetical protein
MGTVAATTRSIADTLLHSFMRIRACHIIHHFKQLCRQTQGALIQTGACHARCTRNAAQEAFVQELEVADGLLK